MLLFLFFLEPIWGILMTFKPMDNIMMWGFAWLLVPHLFSFYFSLVFFFIFVYVWYYYFSCLFPIVHQIMHFALFYWCLSLLCIRLHMVFVMVVFSSFCFFSGLLFGYLSFTIGLCIDLHMESLFCTHGLCSYSILLCRTHLRCTFCLFCSSIAHVSAPLCNLSVPAF